MDQCWELLDAQIVGRVALIVDSHPEIFPVNFVLERRTIVFRTSGGTKLWGAITGKPVAFEIDGYDVRDESAWSVMARGEAELIENQADKTRRTRCSWNRGNPVTSRTTYVWLPRR
jgi:nitroimidazol reductase NimA-like FMN-containing flavoprotein (pyridoxamine 5'-phosphate oxidase superfamily)